MKRAFLGLGSNVGDRHGHLQAAGDALRHHEDIRPVDVSPVYETQAHTVDPTDEQRPFLNAVIEVTVAIRSEELLHAAHAIERSEGRDRGGAERRWAPRPLDVDLLAVGDVTCQTDRLTLPHPRLAERRFVLVPWTDVAPDFVVPAPFKAPVQTLLDACTDSASVVRTHKALSLPTASRQ